jgi:dihydroorotase
MAANTGTYLIRGASLLGGEPGDLLIRDGVIAETGAGLTAEGASVIDAAGLVALPGMVDRPRGRRNR